MLRLSAYSNKRKGVNQRNSFEALIPKLLGEDNFQSSVVHHRTLRLPSLAGARCHTVIAQVQFYQEEELILRIQSAQQLEHKGNKAFIFPHYIPDVMRQRCEFNEVLSAQREIKVEHSLLFPKGPRIKHRGQVESFP